MDIPFSLVKLNESLFKTLIYVIYTSNVCEYNTNKGYLILLFKIIREWPRVELVGLAYT